MFEILPPQNYYCHTVNIFIQRLLHLVNKHSKTVIYSVILTASCH